MRILLVEDEYWVASVVIDLLSELGYDDVHVAADLDAARRLVDHWSPDVAILDVNLGRTQVYPLAAELAARGVPFLFSTSEPAEALPSEWRHALHVQKPASMGQLASALRGCGRFPAEAEAE